MNRISVGIIIIGMVLASGSALAYSCPVQIGEIDAKLAASTSLSKADRDKVKALREQGEKLHKRGDHSGSVKALGEAKDILGI